MLKWISEEWPGAFDLENFVFCMFCIFRYLTIYNIKDKLKDNKLLNK